MRLLNMVLQTTMFVAFSLAATACSQLTAQDKSGTNQLDGKMQTKATAGERREGMAASTLPASVVPVPRNVGGWLERHEENSKRASDGGVGLLFLGDSITEAMTYNRDLMDKYFSSYKPDAFGISGDETQHLLWRVRDGELNGLSPQVIVMLIGTNNLSLSDEDDTISSGVQRILMELEKRFPESKIILLGILPRAHNAQNHVRERIIFVNTNLKQLADNKRVFYIDIGDKLLDSDGTLSTDTMPDFLHPSPAGYEKMFTAIKPLVDKLYSDSKNGK